MSISTDVWRLFVAIELPADVRLKIKKHVERLRAERPDVRVSWIREQNLHFTLKFFGDVPVSEVSKLSAATAEAVNCARPFELKIAGCGAFPPRGQPRVLWIGTEDSSGNLLKLHSALETECEKAGFPREQRSFHPHLTIARLRQPHGARALAKLHEDIDFDSLLVKVEELCLIRSELSSEGSRYTTISHHRIS
jgi:RNA 2',3'-cyclic 3'-phosphodiesterase